jgi:uncharacterized protein YjiK
MFYRALIAIVSFAAIVHAASIAASLAEYKATLKVTAISGITASSISGVTFHPGSKTLYAVDNGTNAMYEFTTGGALLRSIATTGFQDIEGIAHQTGTYFYIAEEGTSSIVRISIPASGTGPVSRSNGTALTLAGNWANNGLEGVSYCPSNKTAFAVKERLPPQLYHIALDSPGNPVSAFANDPFNIENKSGDAADVFALSDGNFLIVDQEENKLVGYSASGQILSELSLKEMTQPEGVAFDTSNGTIYIAGEPRQLFVFRNTTAPVQTSHSDKLLFDFRLIRCGKSGIGICRLSMPFAVPVSIAFLTVQGKLIKAYDKTVHSGINTFVFDLTPQSSGVVLCRLNAGLFQQSVHFLSF